MAHRLKVHPTIFERYAGFRALVLYASGLRNRPSSDESLAVQQRAVAETRRTFGEEKPASHPHISAWRQAYADFGTKPSRFLCSAEALLKRVLRGEDLPRINELVDLYNAVSIRYVLPLGGEDRDHLASDLVLSFAGGGEPFETRGEGGDVVEPSEVVWMDAAGVTCRRWNWRQGLRTALTLETVNAYFLLESLEPYPQDRLVAAGDELEDHILRQSPGCEIEREILSRG
jgi:DNA/RNA-binding domain of Phe-tRNA-synthetase-like protein